MRALLDINVLIALFDEDHTHHVETTGWLEENIDHGWGFLSTYSEWLYPDYVTTSLSQTPSTLLKSSRDCKKAVSTKHHRFVTDNVSLLNPDTIDHACLLSPRQLTDIYLLALAVEKRVAGSSHLTAPFQSVRQSRQITASLDRHLDEAILKRGACPHYGFA